jgi:hypothetical protein
MPVEAILLWFPAQSYRPNLVIETPDVAPRKHSLRAWDDRPLSPARELVGEMLLILNEPAKALEQFEATLKKEPRRFNSLYGAAHAEREFRYESALFSRVVGSLYPLRQACAI